MTDRKVMSLWSLGLIRGLTKHTVLGPWDLLGGAGAVLWAYAFILEPGSPFFHSKTQMHGASLVI